MEESLFFCKFFNCGDYVNRCKEQCEMCKQIVKRRQDKTQELINRTWHNTNTETSK